MQEHKIFLQVSQRILQTIDLWEILQIISNEMAELLDIETAAIYLLENANDLYLGATTPPIEPGMPDFLRKAKTGDHPSIKEVIATKSPNIITAREKCL